MNTLCIIIAIVKLIENIKLFFFKVLVFCQISLVCKLVPYYCGTNSRRFNFHGTSGNPILPQFFPCFIKYRTYNVRFGGVEKCLDRATVWRFSWIPLPFQDIWRGLVWSLCWPGSIGNKTMYIVIQIECCHIVSLRRVFACVGDDVVVIARSRAASMSFCALAIVSLSGLVGLHFILSCASLCFSMRLDSSACIRFE